MPVYQFYQDRKDSYRVQAKDKETALKVLEKVEENKDESFLEGYFDRSEICVNWIFDGEF